MQNPTVRALALRALARTDRGYRFSLAVYVANTGWITPLYMALIDPFRCLFIYPAMLEDIFATRLGQSSSPTAPES